MNSENSGKKSLKIRLILACLSFIFTIVVFISMFWLSPMFVELGIPFKDRYVIVIVVIVTFIVGFFTGKFVYTLESKYK